MTAIGHAIIDDSVGHFLIRVFPAGPSQPERQRQRQIGQIQARTLPTYPFCVAAVATGGKMSAGLVGAVESF